MASSKAFFLDRDGVLIEEANYLSDPGKARLCAGAAQAILKLRQAGYAVVVVSNQSGVARGKFTMKAVEAVQMRIVKLLKAQGGASVNAWYYCPHHPEGKIPELAIDCECRKPKPGLLLQAAKELSIDLGASFMIGDKISDLEAGMNAGCKAVAMVQTGHGSEQDANSPILQKAIMAAGIADAVNKLLALGK